MRQAQMRAVGSRRREVLWDGKQSDGLYRTGSIGRTTLLITHRLSQIRWADRILLLRRGRVVDQGTHEELLARSALYRGIFAGVRAAGQGAREEPALPAARPRDAGC
jgi:ABC-type sugar transport system ATPase subunit